MPKFLDNYKNPCWKEESSPGSGKTILRCLPYYYIGGFYKCATRDLYFQLINHPMISETHKKEVNWWTTKRVQMCDENDNLLYKHDLDVEDAHLCGETLREYVNYNHMSSDTIESYTIETNDTQDPYHPMIFGDGTVGASYKHRFWPYLPENKGCDIKDGPCHSIAEYIHHVTPSARIILAMRTPAKQVYSWYLFLRGHNPQQFHTMVVDEINLIESCLKENTLRGCATNSTLWVMKEKKVNIFYALYYPYVVEWLKAFPKDQMFFLQTEYYAKVKRIPALNEIFQFLELDPLDKRTEEKIRLQDAEHNQTDLHSFVGQMLPKTKLLLDRFYAPYNKLLADLLHDKKWLFLD